jgi:mRNA-degrading endonuclease toxin of MazEF toxin-antitoxin module
LSHLQLKQGDVVFVTVLDPQMSNAKERPCVVVVVEETTCVVVAVTSTFDDNSLTQTQLRVPHATGKMSKCTTGLNRDSVADVSWTSRVSLSECRRVGFIPPKLYAAIKQRFSDFLAGSN